MLYFRRSSIFVPVHNQKSRRRVLWIIFQKYCDLIIPLIYLFNPLNHSQQEFTNRIFLIFRFVSHRSKAPRIRLKSQKDRLRIDSIPLLFSTTREPRFNSNCSRWAEKGRKSWNSMNVEALRQYLRKDD